ncbi:jg21908, partial [Pararge aegeria aegeria]
REDFAGSAQDRRRAMVARSVRDLLEDGYS